MANVRNQVTTRGPAGRIVGVLLTFMTLSASAAVGDELPDAESRLRARYDELAKPLFAAHCIACHGDGASEGGVSLVDLEPRNLPGDDVELWSRVVEVLKFHRMPPPEESQPAQNDVDRLTRWIMEELAAAGRESDVEHKLRQPAYANWLNHEKLFDGSQQGPAYSPPRLWRLHPQAYDNFLTGFGRELKVGGPLSKPFTLGDDKGLASNYAELMQADSATLSQLMLNCKQIAQMQTIGFTRMEKDRKTKQMVERLHRRSPASFEAILDGSEHPTDEQVAAAVTEEFEIVLGRSPDEEETAAYADLLRRAMEIGGKQRGLRTMAMAVLLRPEAIYRMEVGLGPGDEHGRRMLSPFELAYAIAYALTDTPPDKLMLGPEKNRRLQSPSLLDLAKDGKLKSREDVRRIVTRIWEEDRIEKPRILRFFREFFGYHHAETVFKGDRAGREFAPRHLVKDADDLVLYHVRQDQRVLENLLTTDEYFVVWAGSPEDYERRIEYITKRVNPMKTKDVNYRYFVERTKKGLRPMPQANPTWRKTVRFYNLHEQTWDYPLEQPFKMPAGQRVGLLTHPTWLAAWSGNFDNDPIRRGKWIREHLLAGNVPDVPITVDASVPEDPHKTLRQRLEKTRQASCWKCHEKMDPLGLPFEAYDDFGQHRTEEGLGHTKSLQKPKRTAPVVETGEIVDAGDPAIEGKVENVRELMERLASSSRVRQSFVRHAFRYWMGRNEMMVDSPTLMDAERAYVDHDGSFKSLVISLLTSDSFLYRKERG